jgi:hypothetical protein
VTALMFWRVGPRPRRYGPGRNRGVGPRRLDRAAAGAAAWFATGAVERVRHAAGHQVYDGSFSGAVHVGEGVTAALLRRHGIDVLTTLPDEG